MQGRLLIFIPHTHLSGTPYHLAYILTHALFNHRFDGAVKLKAISIIGGSEGTAPAKMKVGTCAAHVFLLIMLDAVRTDTGSRLWLCTQKALLMSPGRVNTHCWTSACIHTQQRRARFVRLWQQQGQCTFWNQHTYGPDSFLRFGSTVMTWTLLRQRPQRLCRSGTFSLKTHRGRWSTPHSE